MCVNAKQWWKLASTVMLHLGHQVPSYMICVAKTENAGPFDLLMDGQIDMIPSGKFSGFKFGTLRHQFDARSAGG